MAQIISFADILRARQRARDRAVTQQCVDLIELNLRLALENFASGPLQERAVRARQIRLLGELLEYALQAL